MNHSGACEYKPHSAKPCEGVKGRQMKWATILNIYLKKSSLVKFQVLGFYFWDMPIQCKLPPSTHAWLTILSFNCPSWIINCTHCFIPTYALFFISHSPVVCSDGILSSAVVGEGKYMQILYHKRSNYYIIRTILKDNSFRDCSTTHLVQLILTSECFQVCSNLSILIQSDSTGKHISNDIKTYSNDRGDPNRECDMIEMRQSW